MDVIDNKENKENLKHIFKMFDADNNEKLDRKEMAVFVSYLAKFATFQDEKSSIEFNEKMIEDLDVNKDGEINEAEFIQVVVKNEISHEDYKNLFNNNKRIYRNVVSIRSFNYALFTLLHNETALTSYYDKMKNE